MDNRLNWNHPNAGYYNQIHQEDDQHTSQTPGVVPASGPSWSHPAPDQPQPYQPQPYQSFDLPPQIPPSPSFGPELNYLLGTLPPEVGQTSGGVAESGPSWNYPMSGPVPGQTQPYQDFGLPPQISPSFGSELNYLLETLPPEVDQTSGGVAASGSSWNYSVSGPVPGQSQPYQGFDFPSWMPPSRALDFDSHPPQPTPLEDVGQNDALPGSSNPQPAANKQRRRNRAEIKEQFLAGLVNYAQGVPLVNCSPSLQFSNYIKDDGSLVNRGLGLRDQFTEEENKQLDHAIIARQGARLDQLASEDTVAERFLAGLDNYAQGVRVRACSATIDFSFYVTDQGHLRTRGREMRSGMLPEDQERLDRALLSRRELRKDDVPAVESFLAGLANYAQDVKLQYCSAAIDFNNYVTDDGHMNKRRENLRATLSLENQERLDQALLSRRIAYLKRSMDNAPVEERFLAGLANYAQGVPLDECSATLSFRGYVSDHGNLQKAGRSLCARLSREDKEQVNQALASRKRIHGARPNLVEKRFLASLDNYERGLSLMKCSTEISLGHYLTDDGRLRPGRQGKSLYERLGADDKTRVNKALTTRRRMVSERLSGDVELFMNILELYGNGMSLQDSENQFDLVAKAKTYLTPEGGLTHKGNLLIENLQPDQLNKVWEAIEKRQRCMGLNPQVSEPSWQRPEMPSSMPEMSGMDPTAMVDPMRTEAMWATTWQLTGQAVPGSSASAEPSIPYYDREAVGENFQHQYDDQYGLIPQEVPDRLIGRGLEHYQLINILGEVYRVYDMGDSVGSTNENPLGKNFMLIPRMRGG
jgi:hypothetical protein